MTDWKVPRGCGSPEQAEAEACLQGLCLTEKWIRQPTWVEADKMRLDRNIGRDSSGEQHPSPVQVQPREN
jgi:hypothetical protein